VDAVVFADPRESIVDTVQTVGRAWRRLSWSSERHESLLA